MSTATATLLLHLAVKGTPRCNPLIVVYDEQRRELGRTEAAADTNTRKAVFSTAVPVLYYFSRLQTLHVCVHHAATDEPVAEAKVVMAHIMSSPNATLTQPLHPQGDLTVAATEPSAFAGDTIAFTPSARILRSPALFKTDAYFRLRTPAPTGEFVTVYESEDCLNSLQPTWKPVPPLPVSVLTSNDTTRCAIRIECYHRRLFGSKLIGYADVAFDDLLRAVSRRAGEEDTLATGDMAPNAATGAQDSAVNDSADDSIPLVNPSGNDVHARFIIGPVLLQPHRPPTIAQHMRGGLRVDVAVVVDFSAANLPAADPESLHHTNAKSRRPNPYVQAITACAEVLIEYDADRRLPFFGFSARVVPGGEISDCFNASLGRAPYVRGVQGMLDAYCSSVETVEFGEPTHMASAVRKACQHAAGHKRATYTVVLVFTQGILDEQDFAELKEVVLDAESAPVSIVIVGVGANDFSQMLELAASDGRPSMRGRDGRVAVRDLVHFVPYRDYARNETRDSLTDAVLKEIPGQMLDWAKRHGKVPEPIATPQQPHLVQHRSETTARSSMRKPPPPVVVDCFC